MKTKLIAAAFSAAIFSAGTASAVNGNFSYSPGLQGGLNHHHQITSDEFDFLYENGFITPEGMHPEGWEDAWRWVKKFFPHARAVSTIVGFIKEYGIPAMQYLAEHMRKSEITANCEWFYEDEDYWYGEMSEEEAWDYEVSENYEFHAELTDAEWDALQDFCHEQRPRH